MVINNHTYVIYMTVVAPYNMFRHERLVSMFVVYSHYVIIAQNN